MLSSHARDRRAASSSPTNVKKAGISVSENVNKAERNRFPNGSESSPPSTLLSSAELPGVGQHVELSHWRDCIPLPAPLGTFPNVEDQKD